MEAVRVLHRLRERGVHLRAQGETLVAAPRNALTDELRALIRNHKQTLLDALASEPAELQKRAREERRQRAIQVLQETLTRSAFIAGAPTAAGVPVMVAVRSTEGAFISGEVLVPRDKWDPVLFLGFLQEMDQRRPS
jgi:hypothetical protein